LSRSSQESVHRVSSAEIIFAAAGAAALLALLIAACVCCSRKTAPRRRRKPQNPMHFYADATSSHQGKAQCSQKLSLSTRGSCSHA
jgi:hypothetical protein